MANRSSTKLPRAPKGAQFVAIEPEVWDLVMETLEYAQRITVTPPLMMSDTPVGKRISLQPQANGQGGTDTDRGQKQGDFKGMFSQNQVGWGPPFAYETI